MNANAQVSGAAVSLECEGIQLIVTDPLAAANDSFECTVSNPTAYLNLPAGENATFYVSVAWDAGVDSDTVRSITTTATVTAMDDVPPPNSASSSVNTLFDFGHDYSANGCTTDATTTAQYIQFQMGNNLGSITFELNHSAAPIHAENFALLSLMGCYDDTIFHRVIDNFMIQGGDFMNFDGTGGHAASWQGFCNGQASNNSSCSGSGSNAWTIPDEANNGLIHSPYVLSMAKTMQPNTAGSQFFIVDDSSQNHLDGVHTVFGKVVDGSSVVDSISEIATGQYDRPVVDIVIEQAIILSGVDVDPDSMMTMTTTW